MFCSLRRVFISLLIFSSVHGAISATLHAGDPDRLAGLIAPYLDEQSILVAHVDLAQIDLDAVVANAVKLVPLQESEIAELKKQAEIAKTILDAFIAAGGHDVFSAFSLADLSDLDHDPPVFVVVPVAGGGDPNKLLAILSQRQGGPFQKVERFPADGPILAGNQATIDRLRALQVMNHQYLTAAFAAVENDQAQLLFLPNEDHRRVLREMFPKLPEPLTAIDGPTLADGLLWASLGIRGTPELSAQLVIGSQDAQAAQRMAVVWQQLIDAAGAAIAHKMESGPPAVREMLPMVDQIKPLLQPQIKNDQLIITLEEEAIHPIVQQVFLPAVVKARQNAMRAQRMNQFKQIALAMHMWHDQNKSFPPAAICDPSGKPLLSWRVAILPYLDQKELYDQFHLDEPWDSEHNRKLIEKMPDIFKDPELASKVAGSQLAPGKTTYMVPVGEGLVFSGKEGIPFQAIKDGTSQTILLVEVSPEHAVPWTKPADWEVDSKNPLAGVQRTDREYITIGFCDGSVRIQSNFMAPEKFWKLLTPAGGEVIED